MRNLTLDEKISLKGVFEAKGISELPALTMSHALSLFKNVCGNNILDFPKFVRSIPFKDMYAPIKSHSWCNPTLTHFYNSQHRISPNWERTGTV